MAVDRRADPAPPKNDRTDLEVWLRVKGPDFLRRQAANLVLGVALLIALAFFLYSRQRNKSVEQVAIAQNAAAAYDFALQLRQSAGTFLPGDAAAREQQQTAINAMKTADEVLTRDAATTAQKAIAQLAKADVNWTLANLPERTLATTQPIGGFIVKPPAAYLDDAEAAYTEILRSYTNEKDVAASALLGLAAIAENRGKFDDADKWYGQVIADGTLGQTYRDIAAGRRAMLVDLRKPYTLASTQPTSLPTSKPAAPAFSLLRPTDSTTMPSDAPTTTPSTAPTTPSTAPTTLP